MLTFVLIEFGICAAVLVPWSFSRLYWLRCLILLLVFGVWLMMMAITLMHSGNVVALHVLWLLGINIIILVLLVASIIAEVVSRRKNQANSQ